MLYAAAAGDGSSAASPGSPAGGGAGGEPRRAPLARHELQFVIEHRPVLDQLIHPHRQSPHEHGYCRTAQVSTAKEQMINLVCGP